jgi:hypothetical protein
MIRTTLADFLMTGRIGPIGEGSTRADVRRSLGQPDGWLRRGPQRSSTRWWYGSLEIGFDGRTGPLDRVGYLQIEERDRHGRFGGDRRVYLHDDRFTAEIAGRPGLKRFARRHGIPMVPVHTEWHGEGFLAPGGVTAWFGDDPAERHFALRNIHHRAARPVQPSKDPCADRVPMPLSQSAASTPVSGEQLIPVTDLYDQTAKTV